MRHRARSPWPGYWPSTPGSAGRRLFKGGGAAGRARQIPGRLARGRPRQREHPLSIIMPCRRVIGADGSITGYGWGASARSGCCATRERVWSGRRATGRAPSSATAHRSPDIGRPRHVVEFVYPAKKVAREGSSDCSPIQRDVARVSAEQTADVRLRIRRHGTYHQRMQ
jgi:6-O-methylguanine DNA methyltransferase, DNA binding domain